jgi:hypothetical protein
LCQRAFAAFLAISARFRLLIATARAVPPFRPSATAGKLLLSGKLGKQMRGAAMPKTDYTDQEISFPRLEARVHKTDDDAFHMRIWIWDRPGDGSSGERREIMNGKRAGSYADITDMIYACAREHSVAVGPDDITIDDH